MRRAFLRRFRQITRALQYELVAVTRRGALRPRAVLYESFAGNGALCNPEAIFRELLRAPDLDDLLHIWALDPASSHDPILREFADDPRVRFVRRRSVAYFRALSTSGYLINNATFPPEFGKRPGQVYLNTWHGTPLKLMGYDMPNGAMEAANTLRNFVAADYLLSQNPWMTDTMYASAYKLDGLYRGLVIEEGYPRVDRQVMDDGGVAAARAALEARGLSIGDRRIVLYAPTWRGTTFNRAADNVEELLSTVREVQGRLGSDRHVVLLKTHQIVSRFAGRIPELARILVPNDIPTNVVLGLTDTLVTDYSSIFFDFLGTGRRILFYAPDMGDYSDVRGTYFPPQEWPGEVCTTAAQLADGVLAEAEDAAVAARRADWSSRFEDGSRSDSARRVVDIVFRGQRDGYRVRSLASDDRPSVLIHLGGMRSNGITSSALNLLSALGEENVDVSATFASPRSAQQIANQALIPAHVRQFPRQGGMNGSKLTAVRRKAGEWSAGTSIHRTIPAQSAMWDAEWMRCYGDSHFDAVVDFSGYSPFWATLLLHSPDAVHAIWLHNDMSAEVGRARAMKRNLPAVFGLYPDFDALVSVSPSLSDINREALAGSHIPASHFRSARNPLDASRVLAGAGERIIDFPEFVEPALGAAAASGAGAGTATGTGSGVAAAGVSEPDAGVRVVPAWAHELSDPARETVWFVTVGRYSPEKNQARLLRAFAAVHAEQPHTRLLLVGYGPLEAELDALIESLGIENAAWTVGPFANPFAIMAAADCFVMSSDYEGQPMVILEAAALGKPIVSVEFASVRDALPDSDGAPPWVVEQTDAALADGLRAYLRGEVLPTHLDPATYNHTVMGEFLRAVGALGER
ncbi:CDP-glycerol glycerophosphotransferase family protein [Galbitalea soli]|uniref:Glycosyltransferase n=1 Tax=Galbitalea soli TaxID=1268042 RepID=A0A7C9TS06_9MICO|nr:glycosyltransferase [Galbitalea soli]NYJ29452.1 CDP-glycerol glycerophosphotransferase (TagB/SpsB family)/glycosyltransferase involved in cell wall biosynthesis [Galbitalea soli]